MEKLAQVGGFPNSKAANTAWWRLKKKITAAGPDVSAEDNGDAAAQPETPASTRKTPARGKKTAAPAVKKEPFIDEEDGDVPVTPTPAKKRAVRPRKVIGDDDDDFPITKTPVTGKHGRKLAAAVTAPATENDEDEPATKKAKKTTNSTVAVKEEAQEDEDVVGSNEIEGASQRLIKATDEDAGEGDDERTHECADEAADDNAGEGSADVAFKAEAETQADDTTQSATDGANEVEEKGAEVEGDAMGGAAVDGDAGKLA